MEKRFIADVHLGKLARLLRMFGIDTLYENNFNRQELITICQEQSRILLSRDTSFVKNKSLKYFIVSDENPFVQLTGVIDHFELREQFEPFSRCIACNGKLEVVSKNMIIHLLEENTANYFNEFFQCSDCKHIYWKGSHYKKMVHLISDLGTNSL